MQLKRFVVTSLLLLLLVVVVVAAAAAAAAVAVAVAVVVNSRPSRLVVVTLCTSGTAMSSVDKRTTRSITIITITVVTLFTY